MQVIDLRLSGLKKIIPCIFRDERGFFFESYRKPLYEQAGVATQFVQDNSSYSCKGTIRGLHFQSGVGQAKLISCAAGVIWDVAVDLRPSSPTFKHWEAHQIDSESCCQIFIPAGFAHGYCVLSETAFVQYKVSSVYDAAAERSIRWNDPDIAISWPEDRPILSLRDRTSPFFHEMFP